MIMAIIIANVTPTTTPITTSVVKGPFDCFSGPDGITDEEYRVVGEI